MTAKELLLGFLVALLPMTALASSIFPLDVNRALQSAKEIYLATRRADGSRSKIVPVWFMYDGEAIYFSTSPASYKAKRIDRGSPVEFWVGSKTGAHFTARGKLLYDPNLASKMARHYNHKYWLAWAGFFRPSAKRLAEGKIVLVKLTPDQVD